MCRQLTLVTFVIFANKRGWGNQYRKIQLQSKKQPKLRGEPDAEVWLRSAANSLLWNRLCLTAAAPTQAPATSGPFLLPAAGSPRRAVLEELELPQVPSLTHIPELPHACLHSKSLSRGVHAENRRADCPCERWVTCAYQGAMTLLLTSRRVLLAEFSPPRVPET